MVKSEKCEMKDTKSMAEKILGWVLEGESLIFPEKHEAWETFCKVYCSGT